MASLGGLISGVLGGAAKAYGEGAQMEMKKQSELDLRKQLLEAESEKRLREDETRRERDRAEETRKMSPEYIAQTTAADLERGKGAIANRTTLAPLGAGADIAEGGAKLGVQMALAPAQAAAAKIAYDAGKPLDMTKAADAVIAKIAETTSLAGSDAFIKGETKLSMAKNAATIEAQRLRNEGYLNRPSSGGAGGKPKSETTADLDRIVKRSEADAARILGVDKKDLNRTYSNLQKKKDPASVALLEKTKPYMDELDAASTRLKNWKAGAPQPSSSGPSSTGPRDLSKYEAKAD
jgi:hypothetical protein